MAHVTISNFMMSFSKLFFGAFRNILMLLTLLPPLSILNERGIHIWIFFISVMLWGQVLGSLEHTTSFSFKSLGLCLMSLLFVLFGVLRAAFVHSKSYTVVG
jgi:ABC-type sulfate transport system permease component